MNDRMDSIRGIVASMLHLQPRVKQLEDQYSEILTVRKELDELVQQTVVALRNIQSSLGETVSSITGDGRNVTLMVSEEEWKQFGEWRSQRGNHQ